MSDRQAQAHGRRIGALLAREGETISLLRSGVTRLVPALAAPMDGATTGTYFDANESVGLLRPALTLYVNGAEPDPPALNDVFFRDGRQWTVRKTFVFREGAAPLLLLALCD